MYLHEYILVITSFVFAVGLPIYNYARDKMSAEAIKIPDSKYRVFCITLAHILLNILALVVFFAMFISILQSARELTSDVIVMGLVFSSLIALSFYGSGIYITSIVLEEYTLPQLRHIKQFKTQFIATHLFHGPISHIMIFTGYIFAFLILTLLEIKFGGLATDGASGILIVSGIVLGMAYAAAQITNGTAPYQLVSSLIATAIFLAYFMNSRLDIGKTALPLYFLSAAVSFLVVMLVFISSSLVKGRKINWDQSGY